jgi:hypothetical protein
VHVSIRDQEQYYCNVQHSWKWITHIESSRKQETRLLLNGWRNSVTRYVPFCQPT